MNLKKSKQVSPPLTFRSKVVRSFLLLIFPFSIVTGIAGYYNYTYNLNTQLNLLKAQETGLVKLGHNVISDVFYPVVSDLQSLVAITQMHQGRTHHDALTEDFIAFGGNKRYYQQVRYIDTTGKEVLRINYQDKDWFLVPEAELQNKKDRYYFTEAMKLKKEDIYLSPFDLNIENGKVEIPIKPVIRFAKKVFDKQGKEAGIVVINYLGEFLLDRFHLAHRDSDNDVMILNNNGYWLHANDASKNWGFMFPGKENESFAYEYPSVWKMMQSSDNGQVLNQKGLFTFDTLFPKLESMDIDPESVLDSELVHHKAFRWYVASFVSATKIDAIKAACRSTALNLMALAMLLGGIVLWFITLANELKQSSQRNKLKAAIQDVAMDCIITCNTHGVIQDVNPAAEHEFGLARAAMVGQPFDTFILSSERNIMATSENQLFECVAKRNDGSTFDAEMTISKVNFSELEGFTCFLRNITEKNKAVEEYRKLSHAIEQMDESVILTDRFGIIEYVNPAFTSITGFDASEAIGQKPSIINSGLQGQFFYQQMWQALREGKVWQGKVVNRRKDGILIPTRLTISPMTNASGEVTHFVGIGYDMTEQEKLENQFQQSQKMEAIGTLVGGIAHDFNNILTGITGQLFLARLKAEKAGEHDIAKDVEDAERMGFVAADIIKQLLAFSRKNTVNMTQFDLRVFIDNAIKMRRAVIPETIRFNYDYDPGSMLILGDTTQVQQILLNLLINASHALADSSDPVIEVAVRQYEADAVFAKRHDVAEHSRYILLSVSDNGCGISDSQIENIFEPFFTTKEIGKGTGLGLAMVYGSVHSHQGLIEVESQIDAGSTFNLYFPMQEQEEMSSQVTDNPEVILTDGQGVTILLVDDDESVLRVTQQILGKFDYKCITARDGQEAVQLFKTHQGEIKLVITDIVMPHMDGVEAAIAIHQVKSDTPVIFASGYQRGSNFKSSLPTTLRHYFISKPFSVSDLRHVVQSALGKR